MDRGTSKLQLTSRLSEVSRSEIWGFFAGKSQIIAVSRPERKREPARRGKKTESFRRVKINFQGGHCIREVVAIFLLLFLKEVGHFR